MFGNAVDVVRETRDARFHLVVSRHVETGKSAVGRRSLVPCVDAHPTSGAAGVYDNGVFDGGGRFRRRSRDNGNPAADEQRYQRMHCRRQDENTGKTGSGRTGACL